MTSTHDPAARPEPETQSTKDADVARLQPISRTRYPGLPEAADIVIARAVHYQGRWQDRDDAYWFYRLSQEVGELGSSLAGDHDDPPEHELEQIASIALNWLARRRSHPPSTPQ